LHYGAISLYLWLHIVEFGDACEAGQRQKKASGAQSVERAILVLRAVAAATVDGSTLSQVVAASPDQGDRASNMVGFSVAGTRNGNFI
jgi:hypothetical protein